MAKQQAPKYLWIGCSDSRVPANEILGLLPGEVFVHRNVANVVVHADLNCLSVIQYAIDVLRVEHIIVCGHYGCGGVQAVLEDRKVGLVDNWLRHVKDVHLRHMTEIKDAGKGVGGTENEMDALCELNVIEQAYNVCQTTVVQNAWARGQKVSVHSWIFGIRDGLLQDLGLNCSSIGEVLTNYNSVINRFKSNF